jgi:hypothetical protein
LRCITAIGHARLLGNSASVTATMRPRESMTVQE